MLAMHLVLMVEYLWVPESFLGLFLCPLIAEVWAFTLMGVFLGCLLPLSLLSSGLGSTRENAQESVHRLLSSGPS